ncbi:DEAD/DEAH box helicase [Candidatus Harpocratesius sp.]
MTDFGNYSSTSSIPNWKSLSLPRILEKELYRRGIPNLYPPQLTALKPGLNGHNLLISIPTASGKTLIAEIIALNHLIINREKFPKQMGKWGKILYLCPLKALATEKYNEFSENWKKIGFHVGISRSDVDQPDFRIFQNHLIFLTNEKADSIFRMNPKLLNDISMVIVDEIHLLHDSHRGVTLEFLITRLLSHPSSIQIIGLSATIQNARQLAEWLHADLIESTWRPVRLKEGYYYGDAIEFNDGTSRRVNYIPGHSASASLTIDMLKEGGQVLIFTNSRKRAIQEAEELSPKIRILFSNKEKNQFLKIQSEFKEKYMDESQFSKKLYQCLKGGVAFHHAGMASDQLDFIVRNFNSHIIKVICCTPTLAAGVNTPARRVIIKSLYRYEGDKGSVLIPILEYKQMAGRAGRPRYDPYGEVVILGSSPEKLLKDAESYIHGTPEQIISKLSDETQLASHLLSLFAANTVSTQAQLFHFMERTFYYYQQFISKTSIIQSNSELKLNSKSNFPTISKKVMSRPQKHRSGGRGEDPLHIFNSSEFYSNDFITADEMLKNTSRSTQLAKSNRSTQLAKSNRSTQPTNSNLKKKEISANQPNSLSVLSSNLNNNIDSQNSKSTNVNVEIDSHLIPFKSKMLKQSNYSDSRLRADVSNILEYFLEKDLLSLLSVEIDESQTNNRLLPTNFGKIVSQSYLSPKDAITLREDLYYAKVLYQNQEIILQPVSWIHLLTKLDAFPKYYLRKNEYNLILFFIQNHEDNFIMEQVWEPGDPLFQDFAKQIKMTMVLLDWIDEISIKEIGERYNLGVGDVHRLVELTLWLLRGFLRIVHLDREEGPPIHNLESELQNLSQRVKYGIRSSILPFVNLQGVGRVRARKLFHAGYHNIDELKRATVEDLEKIPLIGHSLATSIYNQLHKEKNSKHLPKFRIKKKKKHLQI